jgi:hypothetical protein
MSSAPRMRRTTTIVFVLGLILLITIGIAPAPPPALSAAASTGCQPGSEGGPKPPARADTAKLCPPDPASKSRTPIGAGTSLTTPAPGSKNAVAPVAFDPHGVTRSGASARGSKDDDRTRTNVAPLAPTIAWVASAGGALNTCGAASASTWTTTSAAFQVISSCTLTLPEAGVVYLNASASVGLSNTPFEARFSLDIDSTSGNGVTDRWVNVYTDSGDGTDKSTAVTLLASLNAGAHTFYFLGSRYAGTGTVQLYDPALSVLYFPSSAAEIKTCGDASNLTWTTTQTTFQQIRACSLDLLADGFVYISGTASVGLSNTDFEGRFRVGVDTVGGTASSDRWVNVYTDSGDGTDELLATSLLTSVISGTHTFYFSGTRYSGTGTVQIYDPVLSVIYFPATSVTVLSCGAAGSDSWTNATTSYTTIRSCSLDVPEPSFAFIDANASAGLNASGAGNEWEGQFRLGVDSTTGSSAFDRWVNVYTDSGDGTDRVVADSGIVNVITGTHTFSFVGRRYAGSGTLRLYSPALTVLVPNGQPHISAIPDQSVPESTTTSPSRSRSGMATPRPSR